MAIPSLRSIQVASSAGAPMASVSSCRAIPALGLDGDRYATKAGTWSSWPKDHEITLIEFEVRNILIAAGIDLEITHLRRNLVTENMRLNPLVGQRFSIGDVLLQGTRLCEPCAYLEKLLGKPSLVRLLAGRGGLRAVILHEGIIREGDPVCLPSLPV